MKSDIRDPKTGVIVGTVHRHLNRRSFNQVAKAPVAYGTTIPHGGIHQFDYVKDGMHVSEVVCTTFLGEVTTNDAVLAGGALLPATPLAPAIVGGRLHQMAQLYQRFEVMSLDVEYITASPTSTPGNIAITFFRDPDTPLFVTGDTAIRQAAANEHFLPMAVWEEEHHRMHIDVDPEDPQDEPQQYTENGQNARFVTDGLLTVIALSDLAASTNFGSVFLRTHVRFSEPTFDPVADNIELGFLNFNWAAVTTLGNEPLLGWTAAGTKTGPLVTSSLTSGSTNLPGYIYVGYIEAITGTPPTWCDQANSSNSFQAGATFYITSRMAANSSLQVGFTISTTLEQAMGQLTWSVDSTAQAAKNQLCYDNNGPYTATLKFKVRGYVQADS